MSLYTIGEIHRMGLLKDYGGKPYKHKATVSNVVNRLNYEVKDTKWGKSKCLAIDEIKRYNERKR